MDSGSACAELLARPTEASLRHWVRGMSTRETVMGPMYEVGEIGVATMLSGAIYGGTVDVYPVESTHTQVSAPSPLLPGINALVRRRELGRASTETC